MTSWWRVGLAVMSASLVARTGWAAPDVSSEPAAQALVVEEPAAEAPSAEAELAIEPARVSMDFKDADLKDVLKAFSEQTGINVIAGQDIGDQQLTVYLQEVAVIDAMDQILRAGNLTYERLPGSEIYIVKAKPASALSVVATITRVYRVRYARVSKSVLAHTAAAFASRTPFEFQSMVESSTGGGGAASTTSAAIDPEDVSIDAIIREVLTDQGEVVVDGRTNSVIVTDVPENFPRIEGVLAALDIRTPQVLVEAELIETSLTKLKDLGIEWGTGSEGNLITFTPGSRSTRFPFGLIGHGDAPSGPTSFTTGTLSFSNFQGILQALEKDTDTKILARPKVLTLDNESAVIRMTADEAIGFSSSGQTGTGTTTSTPERATTGVVLVVTPQVNEQGFITMLIEPTVSKTIESKISPPTGQATPRDPKTRSSRTMVRIRSSDTLVVGGLIDRSEQDSLQRVPILSGIPFFGEAFKNKEINNSESELVVFVTPRILGEAPGTQVAEAAPYTMREQSADSTRQEQIEQTLNRLEEPPL